MRARVIIGTVAGVLAMTTGVALAETAPPDPEVVDASNEVDATTTTTTEAPTETTTTVAAPEEPTTTTSAVVVEEPEAELEAPELEAPDDEEGSEERPQNHGFFVSSAAHDHSGDGNHGASVSEVARSDAGKPERG